MTHKKLNGCEVKLSPVFHGIVLRATPCSVCKSLSAKLIWTRSNNSVWTQINNGNHEKKEKKIEKKFSCYSQTREWGQRPEKV